MDNNNRNLTTFRCNQFSTFTNEEKRKECVEVSKGFRVWRIENEKIASWSFYVRGRTFQS